MQITKDYISKNLLTKKKTLNPNKTKLIELTNEELYLIFNEMEKPLCKCCEKEYALFQTFVKGYRDVCSTVCAASYSWNKSRKTRLEKYGDMNFTNRTKALETTEKKYGDKNYNNRDKYKETCNAILGVSNPSKAPTIKKKKEDTTIKNYGVSNPFQSEIIKDKIKGKIFDTFGVSHFSQSDKHREIMEKNNLWVSLEQKSDFDIYSMKVRNLTERLDLSQIENINLRGQDFELDHKISIYDGFNMNIPIHIIASLDNLEIIERFKNRSKSTKSSICLNDLV